MLDSCFYWCKNYTSSFRLFFFKYNAQIGDKTCHFLHGSCIITLHLPLVNKHLNLSTRKSFKINCNDHTNLLVPKDG